MVKVHFLKSHSISGWLIRLFTFSQWNHVAIEIDGQLYEARGATGVTRSSAKGYLQGWSKSATVEINPPSPDLAVKFLDAQVGKGYDFGGLIALPFRKPWHGVSKWFCSELVAAALLAAGLPKMRVEAHRITPRDLWIRL
jgi:hypothetical protein